MPAENITADQPATNQLEVYEVGTLPEPALQFVGDQLVTVKGRNHLRLYDRELRPVANLRHKGRLHHRLVADPGGRSLVTISQEGEAAWQAMLWQWSAESSSCVPLPSARSVLQVTYSSDGSRIATADDSGLIRVWNEAGGYLYELATDATPVALNFQPGMADRLLVLTSGASGRQQLQLWQGNKPAAIYPLPPNVGYSDVQWSADCSSVLAYGLRAFAWLQADGRLLLTGTTTDPDTGYLHLAPLDSGWLLVCDRDGRLLVCSVERSLLLADFGAELRAGSYPDNCLLDVAADGTSSRLVATSTDRPPYLFDRRQQCGVYLLHFAAAGVHRTGLVAVDVAVSRHGDLLTTTSSRSAERQLNYTKLWAVTTSGDERT